MVALSTMLGAIISHFSCSEAKALKRPTRTLMDEGCSTQPSPDDHHFSYLDPLFSQNMQMTKHISQPARILDPALCFSSFRLCLPCLRNSPASLLLLQWRRSWCWDREAGQEAAPVACFFFSTVLSRLFNFRGIQNKLGRWSPVFFFWLTLPWRGMHQEWRNYG